MGDWAVRALPALLEISKRGGRCFRPEREFAALRPSFRTAVEEAQAEWHRRRMPRNFMEFVIAREQAGEELRLHKAQWAKDHSESVCQLCSSAFSIRNRRHHCRSCGILTCDDCSMKRLLLHSTDFISLRGGISTKSGSPLPWEGEESSPEIFDRHSIPPLGSGKGDKQPKDELNWQRTCDGCFNRLCYEASQPSADHYRVKQLKRCATEVMHMMEDLIEALDDADGDPLSVNASMRETLQLTRDLDSLVLISNNNLSSSNNSSSCYGASETAGDGQLSVRWEQQQSQQQPQLSGGGSGSSRLSGFFRSSMSMKSPPQHGRIGDSSSDKSKKSIFDGTPSAGYRHSLMGPAPGLNSNNGLTYATPQKKSMRLEAKTATSAPAVVRSGEQLIAALKLRDEKLTKTENLIAKFLEVGARLLLAVFILLDAAYAGCDI